MRLTCQPLAHDPVDRVPIIVENREVSALWRSSIDWQCRDGPLRVSVLAAEAVTLPAYEPSEPTVGAIARLNRSTAAVGGLLLLKEPNRFAEHIALTAGVRLFAITTDADVAAWDQALSLGQPVYGVRGTMVCHAFRPDAYAVLSALAYGNFTSEDGLSLTRCDDSITGVTVTAADEITATVVIRDGFEATTVSGRDIIWKDRGNEGYVRLVARSAHGSCWTQPRFIAARPATGSTRGT